MLLFFFSIAMLLGLAFASYSFKAVYDLHLPTRDWLYHYKLPYLIIYGAAMAFVTGSSIWLALFKGLLWQYGFDNIAASFAFMLITIMPFHCMAYGLTVMVTHLNQIYDDCVLKDIEENK